MNMNDILQVMVAELDKNPNLTKDNPMAKNAADILRSGDAQKGNELKNNLISSLGFKSEEEALQSALQYLSSLGKF